VYAILWMSSSNINEAKLSCTSHLFSWNSAIDLAVICDPDSAVWLVYTPEIESALPGKLNWVFGNGAITKRIFFWKSASFQDALKEWF